MKWLIKNLTSAISVLISPSLKKYYPHSSLPHSDLSFWPTSSRVSFLQIPKIMAADSTSTPSQAGLLMFLLLFFFHSWHRDFCYWTYPIFYTGFVLLHSKSQPALLTCFGHRGKSMTVVAMWSKTRIHWEYILLKYSGSRDWVHSYLYNKHKATLQINGKSLFYLLAKNHLINNRTSWITENTFTITF